MKKFDFSDTDNWRYQGAFMNYGSGSDDEHEMAMAIAADMEEANNVPFTPGGWAKATELGYLSLHNIKDKVDPDSRHQQRGTCDHCGTFFKFGAVFENSATGEVAVVGHICAVRTLNLKASDYEYKRLQRLAKAAKSKLRADASMAALAPNRRAVLLDEFDYWKGRHPIITDMHAKFRKWGSLSVRQWALAKKLVAECREKQAELDAERANATPVETGKAVTIEGVVVGTKWVRGYTHYSDDILKLIVRDDRGFKVYGSCPKALYNYDGAKGHRVRFIAGVEASDDDQFFGFYKRPRKVEILDEQETGK